MGVESDSKKPAGNPLLAAALGIFEAIVPGALSDPERALKEMAPKMKFLVVTKVEKPTVQQLEAVRTLDPERNLVQIRKALQASDLEFGPFSGPLAEATLIPLLASSGLTVSLRELTAAESAAHFGS